MRRSQSAVSGVRPFINAETQPLLTVTSLFSSLTSQSMRRPSSLILLCSCSNSLGYCAVFIVVV
jgi:hypothetical protein